jgi:hypothetical protein
LLILKTIHRRTFLFLIRNLTRDALDVPASP